MSTWLQRWALFLPLTMAGCLFVGDVNERPSVTMHALLSSAGTLGQPLGIEVLFFDDQDVQKVDLVVRDYAGKVVDDPCVVGIADSGVSGVVRDYQVTIWKVGAYSVEAIPTDQYGAVGSSAAVTITVSDAPPMFGNPNLQLGVAATACTALYPTGKAIPISLPSSVDDPEQSWHPPPAVFCSGEQKAAPLTYTWHLLSGPASSAATLGLGVGDDCPTVPMSPGLDLVGDNKLKICLYPDPNLPTGTPSMYQIALDVSDGTTTVRSNTLSVPVIGDAAACLDGTYPAVGAYVLDRSEATVFQAVGVDDVTAGAALTFVWSLERPGDTSYVALDAAATAADGGARLVFDPSALGLAVGDHVKLRVEVADPGSNAIACDAADDSCAAASCAAAPATTCPRRATWSLEVR